MRALLDKIIYTFCFLIVVLCLFCSCQFKDTQHKQVFHVSNFVPVEDPNFSKKETITFEADLQHSVLNGIVIPGNSHDKKYFRFSFNAENKSDSLQDLYYKIYYQNETYKWPDSHLLTSENFYGSWEEKNTTFKFAKKLNPGEKILIQDSFRIVGNPRNEDIYFGADLNTFFLSDSLLNEKIALIKNNPEWLRQINEKAIKSKTKPEEQIYLDAMWLINDELSSSKEVNNRWKRNPRMGTYQFMLVVTNGIDRMRIPEPVADISKCSSKGVYINPFDYFLSQKNLLEQTTVIRSERKIRVKSSFNLNHGVFVDKLAINKSNFSDTFYTSVCGESEKLFRNALFKQYFHSINKDFVLRNIPVQMDVVGEGLTRKQYAEFIKRYENSKDLISTYVNSTDCPCRTVNLDSVRKVLQLKNPGNSANEFHKEHVGIKSRVGFTYGKWTAKIKFPELLSIDNVWNGLTNAFWLLYQDDAPWNVRRPCNAEVAYIPKNLPDETASLWKSQKQINYSEIDFEILKESEYWPITSYANSNTEYKKDNSFTDGNIAITCTNWDMACHEPIDYNIGAKERVIDGNRYVHHRWDHFYKALTTKTIAKDDELFKRDYYFFEIDWRPDKIIWRIGTEKNKMRTICVMDDSFSAIPNNQMIMVLTQEWHNQEWWPTAPYKQNFIPFPKKDLVGELISVEIE